MYQKLKEKLQEPRFIGLTREQKVGLLASTMIQRRRPATRAEIIARLDARYNKIIAAIAANGAARPAAIAIRDLLESGGINEPLDVESAGSLKTILATLVQNNVITRNEANGLFGGVDENVPETVDAFGVVVTENDIDAAETPLTVTYYDEDGNVVQSSVAGGYSQTIGVE